jgi:methionine-gamma-lyase
MQSLAELRHEFGEHGGVNMSIETSTTFTVLHPDTMPEIFAGRRGPEHGGCYLYGRHFNPTVYVLGRELAALEGAVSGYATASGMSAIVAAIVQLCDQGDHVVASSAVYGGTHALLAELLPAKTGIRTSFVDITDLAAVEAAITDRTRVVYAETIANPTLVVADLPRLAALAHARGARLVVDNTFAPLMVAPIRLGADVVVHSLTKFVSGASDIIGGAIVGDAELIGSLMDLHTGALMLLGPTMDPRIAFQLSMRLPHLGLRVAEHSRRAGIFAERLAARGVRVIYPGLPHHPQHALLASMAHPDYGFGGLMAIDTGSLERANAMMELLQNRDRFGYIAVSLGYHHTLMSCSSASTSSELSAEEQAAAGIAPGLVRMSVGYTGSLEQRWAQLEDGLRVAGLVP